MTFPCCPSLLLLSCCSGAGEPGCHGNWAVKHPEPAPSALGKDCSGEAQRRRWWRGNRSGGVGRCKADHVRNGSGQFCKGTAQEKYTHSIRNHTFMRKRRLPVFFLTMIQISFCPFRPIHLLSGWNTPGVYTCHIIKGVMTIPNLDLKDCF